MRNLLIILIAILAFGCTQNQRAKTFGGTTRISLEKEQKLINVTWKEDNMWILTTQMDSTYTPKVYIFKEESSVGLLEGTVYIQEVR